MNIFVVAVPFFAKPVKRFFFAVAGVGGEPDADTAVAEFSVAAVLACVTSVQRNGINIRGGICGRSFGNGHVRFTGLLLRSRDVSDFALNRSGSRGVYRNHIRGHRDFFRFAALVSSGDFKVVYRHFADASVLLDRNASALISDGRKRFFGRFDGYRLRNALSAVRNGNGFFARFGKVCGGAYSARNGYFFRSARCGNGFESHSRGIERFADLVNGFRGGGFNGERISRVIESIARKVDVKFKVGSKFRAFYFRGSGFAENPVARSSVRSLEKHKAFFKGNVFYSVLVDHAVFAHKIHSAAVNGYSERSRIVGVFSPLINRFCRSVVHDDKVADSYAVGYDRVFHPTSVFHIDALKMELYGISRRVAGRLTYSLVRSFGKIDDIFRSLGCFCLRARREKADRAERERRHENERKHRDR